MTGEVTLKFADIEDITVPAGTYKTMKIEITSNTLNFHADGTSGIIILDGQTTTAKRYYILRTGNLSPNQSRPHTSSDYQLTNSRKHKHGILRNDSG